MIAVIQIVKNATIYANGEFSGKCGKGLYILLGVEEGDTELDADLLTAKIKKLRIFKDQNDKMNLSVLDIGGECAVVSNFTLYANATHGNRPDFFHAAPPALAEHLYNVFLSAIAIDGISTVSGIFGADMQMDTVCDGPVTIILDTADIKKGK